MIGATVARVIVAPVTEASVIVAVIILAVAVAVAVAVASAEAGSAAAMIVVAPAPEVVTGDPARRRSRPMEGDAAVGGGGKRLNG
jgi:hypothetical protein